MKMNLYCLNWKQYKYWQWIQVFHMFCYIFLEEHPFPFTLPPFANSLQFLPHCLRQLKLKQRQIGPLCVCVCLCWPIVNDKIVDVLASPSPCPLSLCLPANQICVTWTRLPPFPLLACPRSPPPLRCTLESIAGFQLSACRMWLRPQQSSAPADKDRVAPAAAAVAIAAVASPG